MKIILMIWGGKIIAAAKTQSEQIIAAAKTQSEQIIAAAKTQGEEIITAANATAKKQADEIMAKADQDANEIKQKIEADQALQSSWQLLKWRITDSSAFNDEILMSFFKLCYQEQEILDLTQIKYRATYPGMPQSLFKPRELQQFQSYEALKNYVTNNPKSTTKKVYDAAYEEVGRQKTNNGINLLKTYAQIEKYVKNNSHDKIAAKAFNELDSMLNPNKQVQQKEIIPTAEIIVVPSAPYK